MFISGKEIERSYEQFFPDPGRFDPRNVKQACYDLRIGDEVFLSEQRIPLRLSEDSPFVILPPGQFALIKTYEQVSVPKQYVAFISIRSKYKFQGLINISGFHVDPTYEGHLIYAVQNVGPNDIRLKYREEAFMIMWALLNPPYEGPKREKGYDRIPIDLMAQLGGPSVTLESLEKRVRELSLSMKIYGGFAIAASVTVFALVLRILLGRG
jgi:dCTP deaminase